MNTSTKNIFFIKITLTCLDCNNKRVKRKIEMGMIKIPFNLGISEKDSVEYLKSYSSKREFQDLIWKEIERHYSPEEVVIDFIKPKKTKAGIVLSGSISLFRVHFKI